MRVLILGGTTEASALAAALAGRNDLAPVLSLAGRTAHPVPPPIPHRIGGFGGADGLARHLAVEGVEAVVDATHPFAARISANAIIACAREGVPLARLTRPPWRVQLGDRWTQTPDLATAATALGETPRRVLLTVGRLGVAAFCAAPQHRYLVRTIDLPEAADLPPDHALIRDRGPFRLSGEEALMRRERIDVVVAKNSGGEAARAKLDAARALGIEVVLVDRPATPGGVLELSNVATVLRWFEAQRVAPPP